VVWSAPTAAQGGTIPERVSCVEKAGTRIETGRQWQLSRGPLDADFVDDRRARDRSYTARLMQCCIPDMDRHAMAASEVRTQIYLPRRLHQSLRRAARARGVSMAQLIREAAEEAVRRTECSRPDPLADLIGIIRDAPRDLAEGHDDYLYGSSRRRP
jgi:hypothetical protein